MLRFVACVLIVPLLSPTAGRAQEPAAETLERASTADKGEISQRSREVQQSICLLMESAALSNELPIEFFVRLIWQESHFQTDAIGPPTRSGKHALGIAQFMPATAAERDLLDPLDPIDALPDGAGFLQDWRHHF